MLLPDLELAQRLERKEMRSVVNIIAGFAQIYPGSSREVYLPDDAYVAFTGRKQPINRVFNLGLQGPVTTDVLEQVEEFFEQLQMPSEIELCPLAHHSLVELLAQRQYTVSRFINVFYRELHNYATPALTTSNVVVRQAHSTEAELWAKAVSAGFTYAGEIITDTQYALMNAIFHRPDAQLYLAWIDGVVAGGGLLSMEEGVAGLSTASTLHQFRNQGVQTALLHTRLTVATQAGCDLATIHALPGTPSQRNIQRAGFQVAYTNVEMLRHNF